MPEEIEATVHVGSGPRQRVLHVTGRMDRGSLRVTGVRLPDGSPTTLHHDENNDVYRALDAAWRASVGLR